MSPVVTFGKRSVFGGGGGTKGQCSILYNMSLSIIITVSVSMSVFVDVYIDVILMSVSVF